MAVESVHQRLERRKAEQRKEREEALKEGFYPFSIKYNDLPLSKVPRRLRTEKLCYEAVKKDWRNLEHVPLEVISRRICLEALDQDARALRLLPEMLRLPEFCQLAVGKNGMTLGDVPLDERTEYICALAVGENRDALPFAPERIWAPMGKDRFFAMSDAVWEYWRDEREGNIIVTGPMGDAGTLVDPGNIPAQAAAQGLFVEASSLGTACGQDRALEMG